MYRLLLVLLFYTTSAFALIPPLTPRADPEIESTIDLLQRRNKVLLVHAICGFLALQVVAPLAVVIASVGRSWGPIWFKLHSMMQIFLVLPLVALAVGLAAAATTYDVDKSMDKHKVTGFVLLGLVLLQMVLGGWATCAQRMKARNARDGEEVLEKRRVSNWLHIALGITILSVGGLQVTWGLSEWEKLVGAVPTWINIVHFALAGVPVAIVTPFVIVRGLLRMKRGQNFAQAFFDRPTTPSNYVPPRKLFLGGSTYRTVGQDEEKLEEQERLVGYGQSNNELQDGGPPFESEIGWTGAATREEYEATIASSRLRNSTDSEQTIAPSYGESQPQEKHSLLDHAAPLARSGSTFEGKSSGTRSSGSTYPPVSTISAPYFSASPSPLSTTTVSPLTLPSLSPPPPPPPPPPSSLPHSSVSPRLAFMPFSGSTVVHPESAATPSQTSSSVRSDPSIRPEGQVNEVHSALPITQNLEQPVSSVNASAISRHASMAGEIVQVDRGERQSSRLTSTVEETGTEVEDDVTSVLFDDSESTRLMDELERELSVSTTRSRRIRDRFEGSEKGMEMNDVDEETKLARDQSGKWAGSNKRDSSQA